MARFEYDYMRPEESNEVFHLIAEEFDTYVKKDCTEEGVKEFFRAVSLMLFELPENHFNVVARAERRAVGIINVRDFCHISLFFVKDTFQGRGIGRSLFERALAMCRAREPELKMIDVNASQFAVPFYEKLGFKRVGPPMVKRGIRFVEMKKMLLV
jgi:GNAT superfamily N-acetyltransferase